MKYVLKIEVSFTDKYTDKEYKVGNKITVDEARGKELLDDPRHLVTLVEKIDEKSDETAEEDKELEELKAKAKELGIKVTKKMSKEEIIAKIEEVEKEQSETENSDEATGE